MSAKETASTPSHSRLSGLLVVGMISGVMASLATLAGQALVAPHRPQLATVDIAGLVSAEVARLKASGMEPAKAEAYAELWGPLLAKSLDDVAEEHAVVLLVSPSVAAGAPDLTGVLRERLHDEIAHFQ